MTEKLFGTDGIRGVAGKGPLSPERVLAVGRALGRTLGGEGVRAVVCRDTRRSGPLVRAALCSGLLAEGVDVIDAGIRPTPALPYLAHAWDCAFGVVLSASHNPMEYNGIKIFDADGNKISDEVEGHIEREAGARTDAKTGRALGRNLPAPKGRDPYREALLDLFPPVSPGREWKLVVDCANGATFEDAPAVFEAMGFTVVSIHADPDGDNINRECGALHPEKTARAVLETGAFAGVALDGDGDRAILVDETGRTRNGDFILAALGRRWKARGTLPGDTVVGTVMSNIGLEVCLAAEGLRLHRTPVGDRHIASAMRDQGWSLGGEPSGHVIFRGPDGLYPGDGILTALNALAPVVEEDVPLSRLAGDWRAYPQVLLNVPVSRKVPFEEIRGFTDEVDAVREALGDRGRVVLRYSGTEPVARVMVEGPDEDLVRGHAERLASILEHGIKA